MPRPNVNSGGSGLVTFLRRFFGKTAGRGFHPGGRRGLMLIFASSDSGDEVEGAKL